MGGVHAKRLIAHWLQVLWQVYSTESDVHSYNINVARGLGGDGVRNERLERLISQGYKFHVFSKKDERIGKGGIF